ncbi:hypothetical protein B6S12_07680 [Helicobacter valdiviensis]|uniref:Uncharacterized protein n=1 Tax=Helicobacter valdiviensis TaxID=1458358 RepID=A0A2W6PM39_9HELI|nr:hypothetical protein [Helicobacter valdiviensis]PZT47733.1 hypothetical protein B6S12_07680 [Helicobacter valdiviensis]
MCILKYFFILLIVPSFIYAEIYKVYVTREENNLYKTQEGIYIKTKFCYVYAYNQEAILKYDSYSYDNKLIFDYDECQVEKLLR